MRNFAKKAVFLASCGASLAAFAMQAPIELGGDGPYYQMTVPMAVYATSLSSSLADLRIHNSTGQAVPFGWLGEQALDPVWHSAVVPIFAVARAKTANIDGAVTGFTLRGDGRLQVQKTAKPVEKSARDWIFDASQLQGNLVRARLELAGNPQGLFGFALDASDDLKHWQNLSAHEQLTRLNHAGSQIEDLAVDLQNTRARYLRLRWLDERAAPAIKSVHMDSADHLAARPPALEWSKRLTPNQCGQSFCDYPLPINTPLDSLRIHLPERNTLASVSIYGLAPVAVERKRHRHSLNPLHVLHTKSKPAESGPGEQYIAQTVAYRLQVPGAPALEALSPVVALDGQSYTALRIRTDGPFTLLGNTPPSIEFAVAPRALMFLARGSAPFSAHWGAKEKDGAALALSTLIPGYDPSKRSKTGRGVMHIVAPASSPAATPALAASVPSKTPTSKVWLWAALAAGLVLLGGMVWSLLGSMKRQT